MPLRVGINRSATNLNREVREANANFAVQVVLARNDHQNRTRRREQNALCDTAEQQLVR